MEVCFVVECSGEKLRNGGLPIACLAGAGAGRYERRSDGQSRKSSSHERKERKENSVGSKNIYRSTDSVCNPDGPSMIKLRKNTPGLISTDLS